MKKINVLIVGFLLALAYNSIADTIEIGSSPENFKESVSSPANLPATGNTIGDTRVSESNASIYIWDGSAWQGTAGGGAAAWGGITGTLSSQTDLNTALNGKEPTITAGTNLQYYRGDKTFQTLDTLAVAENTNLYFTDARARSAVIASSIVDGDLTHSPDGNSVFDALATKEPTITATTSADYYRGDKTFQPFAAAAQSAVVTQNITNGVTSTAPSEDAVYDSLSLKEPTITATTSADYYRGDKTFQPFNSAAQSAVITQVITNGVTNKSPSEDAVYDALALKQSTSEKNQNNGYAGLDAGGKIDVNQLPNTVMLFKGQWNANTNTPALADGVGTAGFVYRANVAGTTNFGSGNITFAVGDWAVYNGTVWEFAANSNLVTSVNSQQGVVSLDTDDIPEGTALYFTDARAIAAPLTGFTSGAGTVAATDSVLQAIQKLDGNIGAVSTKTPNTIATFDGSGVLQSHPNWNVTPDNNFNLNDTSNSTSGYSVLSASKTGNVTGGTTQGYNFYVNGTIDGYYGFNSNLQGTSTGQVEHLTLNSSQATTGNYFMINGNMTGNITTGGIFGLNMSMSGTSDYVNGLNLSNTGASGYMNALSFNNSGVLTSGLNVVNGVNSGNADYINGVAFTNSGDTTNGFTGINITNTGDNLYHSGINYQNSGTSTSASQMVNLTDNGVGTSTTGVNVNMTGTYSTSVSGIAVDVNSATSPSKVGISNQGALNSNSSYDTANGAPPQSFALNYLGGQFKISSGFPTTNEFGFGNNLATVAVIDDDMPPDVTTLGLGYTHVGFVGSVTIASGKTVDSMNMALGGAGVPSGSGGTITNASMFRAEGFLNQGGTLTATNLYGFRAGTQLCGMGTNCWGFFDESGGENYMGKLAVGTASKKNTATFEFDVLGDSKLDGTLTVTGNQTSSGHTIYNGTSATAVVNANAGTSASCSIVGGNDSSGSVSLTTGSASWAAGAQCAVTFASAYGSAPKCQITPTNANAAAAFLNVYVTKSTSAMTINFVNPDNQANTLTWDYHCEEVQ